MKRKHLFTLLMIAIISTLVITGCDKPEPKPVDPKVIVKTADYYFTDTLPTITATTEVSGKIAWDRQEVKPGVADYKWTFTPTDTKAYNELKGVVELKKVDVIKKDEVTYESAEIESWEDGKSYVYMNATFPKISTSKKIDLALINCTINAGNTGAGGDKCIYLTGIENLLIDGCTFAGQTTAGSASTTGYALDLNLYKTSKTDPDVDKVIIRNSTFKNTVGGKGQNVAISIKIRKGATDNPSDGWASTATFKDIINGVEITNNTFEGTCNNIYMGTSPKGSDNANTTTGEFKMLVSGNKNDVNVYERYKLAKSVDIKEGLTTVKTNTSKTFDGNPKAN